MRDEHLRVHIYILQSTSLKTDNFNTYIPSGKGT